MRLSQRWIPQRGPNPAHWARDNDEKGHQGIIGGLQTQRVCRLRLLSVVSQIPQIARPNRSWPMPRRRSLRQGEIAGTGTKPTQEPWEFFQRTSVNVDCSTLQSINDHRICPSVGRLGSETYPRSPKYPQIMHGLIKRLSRGRRHLKLRQRQQTQRCRGMCAIEDDLFV